MVESIPALQSKRVVEIQEGIGTAGGRSSDHFSPMTDTDTATPHRPREDDALAPDQPPTKKQKLDDYQSPTTSEVIKAPLLPPSHALLGITRGGEPDEDGFTQMLETDVGISEYVGRDIPPIQAVIKQRCTQHINRLLMETQPYISGSRIFWSLRSANATE